jgi:hypothetical protein
MTSLLALQGFYYPCGLADRPAGVCTVLQGVAPFLQRREATKCCRKPKSAAGLSKSAAGRVKTMQGEPKAPQDAKKVRRTGNNPAGSGFFVDFWLSAKRMVCRTKGS